MASRKKRKKNRAATAGGAHNIRVVGVRRKAIDEEKLVLALLLVGGNIAKAKQRPRK